jgi:DNA-binding NarL/FixJ family response regulator
MSPRSGFLLETEVLPRLRAVIPRSVLCIGSEDHEELVQDATCLAARIMHNAEAKRKRITPSNAAFYALQHCKSGRRAVGHSAVDVHGSSTQLNGRSRLESMEEVVASNEECGGEIFELHDVLGSDAEDPSMAVARKLDWEEFCSDLPAREKAVVEFLVEGKSGSAIARKLRVKDSKIRAIKRRLATAIVEFMGREILQEIQRSPAWKNSIHASRERMACKHTSVPIEATEAADVGCSEAISCGGSNCSHSSIEHTPEPAAS